MRKFFLALLTTFAVAVSPAVAADALKDVNPAPVPGEQILMKAELPVQTGDARRGDVKLDESQTETMDFWFFLPSDESAKSDDGFPLMLFLHGAGERGDDPNVVKNHGPAKLCANPEIAKSWKFMTVSPQCKPNRFWSPLQLIELIDRVCESYPVDRSRIYVTGLSMGGFGTWSVASLAADKIAAIVPICGWYAPERAATITMPVWAFHGDADPAVNINSGRAIVEAVREAGNPEVIFTVYPGVNHDSWTRTYANPIIYDWLLSKRLPPTIESPKPVPGKQLAASAKLPANPATIPLRRRTAIRFSSSCTAAGNAAIILRFSNSTVRRSSAPIRNVPRRGSSLQFRRSVIKASGGRRSNFFSSSTRFARNIRSIVLAFT